MRFAGGGGESRRRAASARALWCPVFDGGGRGPKLEQRLRGGGQRRTGRPCRRCRYDALSYLVWSYLDTFLRRIHAHRARVRRDGRRACVSVRTCCRGPFARRVHCWTAVRRVCIRHSAASTVSAARTASTTARPAWRDRPRADVRPLHRRNVEIPSQNHGCRCVRAAEVDTGRRTRRCVMGCSTTVQRDDRPCATHARAPILLEESPRQPPIFLTGTSLSFISTSRARPPVFATRIRLSPVAAARERPPVPSTCTRLSFIATARFRPVRRRAPRAGRQPAVHGLVCAFHRRSIAHERVLRVAWFGTLRTRDHAAARNSARLRWRVPQASNRLARRRCSPSLCTRTRWRGEPSAAR